MDPSRDDLGFKRKPCEREYCPGPMYCWDLHDGEDLPAPDPALFPMSPYDDRMWETFQRGCIRTKRQHTTDGQAVGSRLSVPLLASPPYTHTLDATTCPAAQQRPSVSHHASPPLSATALTTSAAWPATQLPARPYHHGPPRPASQHSAPHEKFVPRFSSHFPHGTGYFSPQDYPGPSSSLTGYIPPGYMGPSSSDTSYIPPGYAGPSSAGTGYIPPGYAGPSSAGTGYIPLGYAGPSSSSTGPFHSGHTGPYSSDDTGSAFPPRGYSFSVTSSHFPPPGYLGRYSSGTGYFSPAYTKVPPPSGTTGYIRPSRLPGPPSLRHRVHSSPLPPTPATFLHQTTWASLPPTPTATFPHQATGASLPLVPAATIAQLDSGAPLRPAPATSLQATQGTLPPVFRL